MLIGAMIDCWQWRRDSQSRHRFQYCQLSAGHAAAQARLGWQARRHIIALLKGGVETGPTAATEEVVLFDIVNRQVLFHGIGRLLTWTSCFRAASSSAMPGCTADRTSARAAVERRLGAAVSGNNCAMTSGLQHCIHQMRRRIRADRPQPCAPGRQVNAAGQMFSARS